MNVLPITGLRRINFGNGSRVSFSLNVQKSVVSILSAFEDSLKKCLTAVFGSITRGIHWKLHWSILHMSYRL
ncbi:unnamed protein product [Lactuca virosa]|uniref:Uncharacterized protein n=1 Tax=Lactuca virosa TaxID=75947 RepID=A0AAU9MG25_9ASTR|nr:unnamed protein product [Lactuca virosa]